MAKNNAFIREITTKAGSKLLKIEIRKYGQSFRKNIKISDFDNKAQAMEFARSMRDEALVKMRKGYTVSSFKSVGEIYQKTFDLYPVHLKTKKKHDIFFNHAIAPYADISIEKITSADVQTCLNKYAETHTRRQVSGLLAIWRRIYKTAVMMNLNIPDRTIPVELPECATGKPREKSISTADLETFIDTLLSYNSATVEGQYDSQCIYYLVQTMRFSGIRPSEALCLTKEDIHLGTSNYISVCKASHSTKTSMLEVDKTKTTQSVRDVPIPNVLLPVIMSCLAWAKHDFLFADCRGNLRDIDAVSDYIRRVAKKAKVSFNLYMLRHNYSTDMFSDGIAPNVIRDLLGHASANMSLDYAVSRPADRVKAVSERKFS